MVVRTVVVLAAFLTLAMQFPFDGRHAPLRPPFLSEMKPGEREIRSLAAGWPDRVSEAGEHEGEWMLKVDGRWFAWAHGRMLPAGERDSWRQYEPYAFYDYPRRLPALPGRDTAQAESLKAQVAEDERHPPRRSEQFLAALLNAPDRTTTESRLIRVEVAGFTVTVHERLREPLARVSRELQFLRSADPQVAAFLRELSEMNGYNYRYVDGTRERSLHSYGAAIDLIPRRPAERYSYWRWARAEVDEWWAIPYEQRWTPPAAFVRAFEREGFVWGGKWELFDTMHFEYRPDLFALRRIPGPLTPTD
ncbi:MAG TPA: M15 family metallopeptidase [Spirochaetia bacterium]|nr:M15 family metallopeptidase [Spirochaetia bacterium]